VRTLAAAHAGVAAVEAYVASIATDNRTAPVVAEAACAVERAIAAMAVARNNELQGRGESSCGIISAPRSPFSLPFRFRGYSEPVM